MQFGAYEFICRLETDAVLPEYKGSTFRGVFGHALKQVVCIRKKGDCRFCDQRKRCIYADVYETKPPLSGTRLAARPHPFVMVPPLSPRQHYDMGDIIRVGLILFGDANRMLPCFIHAFRRMGALGIGRRVQGRRGLFSLLRMHHDGQTVYDAQSELLVPPFVLPDLSLDVSAQDDSNTIRLSIDMQTPLRLKHENHLSRSLPFHVVIRATLRRISGLFAAYGRGEPKLDYRDWVQRAQNVPVLWADVRWSDPKRYSTRQRTAMRLGGLTGSVAYEGVPGRYLPALKLAEQLHLGKQTTFGLGKIRIRTQNDSELQIHH